MDVKVIRDKQLFERWTAGRLSPPEARYFEDLIRKQPELADELGMHDALKRTMRLLDDTGTEWREEAPKFWQKPIVPLALALLAAGALGVALFLGLGKSQIGTQYKDFKTEALQGLLAEPIGTVKFPVHLVHPGEPGVQSYAIGSRKAPTFAELRPDVHLYAGHLYSAKIRREDGTFWGRFDNLLRDSNGQLRIAVNSGAFAAGTYDLEVSQVNLRGDGELVGIARLVVTPGA